MLFFSFADLTPTFFFAYLGCSISSSSFESISGTAASFLLLLPSRASREEEAVSAAGVDIGVAAADRVEDPGRVGSEGRVGRERRGSPRLSHGTSFPSESGM